MIVDLGRHTYVLVGEIVAVHDGENLGEGGYAVTPYEGVESVVVLRSGHVIPAYLSAATVRRRWKKALDSRSVGVTMTLKPSAPPVPASAIAAAAVGR